MIDMAYMQSIADEKKAAFEEYHKDPIIIAKNKEIAYSIVSEAMNMSTQDAVNEIAGKIKRDFYDQLCKSGKMIDEYAVISVLHYRGNVNSSSGYAHSNDTLMKIKNRVVYEISKISVPSLKITIKSVTYRTGYKSYEIPMSGNETLVSFLLDTYPDRFDKFDASTTDLKSRIYCKDDMIACIQVNIYFDAILV